MTVTVVIPTWRRGAYLQRAAGAVASQEPRPDEILIVGRDDDTQARIVAESVGGQARWVGGAEPGHVLPVIRGLSEAAGDIVVFLDDDAEPETGWLQAILQPFADERVACVGGRVVTPGWRGVVHPDAGQIRWYGKYVGNIGALEAPAPIDVAGVMEGNWAWRADVLRSLAFDPRLDIDDASMYGLDLCLQATYRGWRIVYHPAARVIHHAAPREGSIDRGDRAPRVVTYARNYTIIALERFRGVRRAAFVVWWWLVGEGDNYGLLGAVYGLVRRRRNVGAMTAAGMRGRREGVRAWRRGR